MHTTDLVILVCLLLSAFFSGMEIAFVASNRIFLEIEKQQKGLRALGLNLLTKNPSRFIATMLVGNNIALVVYGIFMGDRILQLLVQQSYPTGSTEFLFVLSNPHIYRNYTSYSRVFCRRYFSNCMPTLL